MLVRNRQRPVVAARPPVARAVVVRECSCCRGRRRSGSVSVVELSVLVEDLMAHVTMPPTGIRWWRDDACLNFQPGPYPYFANVSAVRSSEGSIAELVATAKGWFGARGREDFLWILGPSSTPSDLRDQLVQRGAQVLGNGTAMTMDTAPPAVAGVVIKEVESRADLLTARRIMFADEITGQVSAEQDLDLVRRNAEAWAAVQAMNGTRRNYLAFIDDEPVAAGGLQLCDQGFAVLAGSATVPAARGRGCYRALVHHRWTAAQGAGIRHLAIQASDNSAPILRRIGFTTCAALTIMKQSCV
jgi:hypothetical protein